MNAPLCPHMCLIVGWVACEALVAVNRFLFGRKESKVPPDGRIPAKMVLPALVIRSKDKTYFPVPMRQKNTH